MKLKLDQFKKQLIEINTSVSSMPCENTIKGLILAGWDDNKIIANYPKININLLNELRK